MTKMRSNALNRLLVLLAGFFAALNASAANPSVNAKDEEFWTGTAFVLIGKVKTIEHPDPKSTIHYKFDFEPRATIGGLFNPAATPTMTIETMLGFDRWTVPKVDDLLLIVVYDDSKLGIPQGGFGLANGRCDFMPNSQALIVLKSMDDPVVTDVLHKMQAARPTTRPATAPVTR